MSSWLVFAAAGVAVFAIGAVGAFTARQAVRSILSLNVAGSGVFLLLVAIGRRADVVDPVPQSLVLTGVVVSVSATALALALARRLATMDEEDEPS